MINHTARSRLLSVFIFIFLSGVLTVGSAVSLGRNPPDWVPDFVRYLAFDIQLALSPEVKKLSSISKGSPTDLRIYIDNYGEDVQFKSNGLTIAGTLYSPDGAGNFPAVVLIHGSTPEARKLGLYRLLGKELAGLGYIVLAIDLRGFGESDDPPLIDELVSFDFKADIGAAVDYMTSLENADTSRLYIIGHSAGADQAFNAGIEDPRVQKIVAIGPSRRIKERYGDETKAEFSYFQRRVTRYMRLSQTIPAPIFKGIVEMADMDQHLEYFSSPDHKPLLLIDGELEDQTDLVYLQEYYNAISEPKKYSSLEGSDHYANTANWGSLVIYDQQMISSLVEEIDRWLAD
jgi:dienelactone hydrolase